MAVKSLSFEHESLNMASLNVDKSFSSWYLGADARIKTAANPLGIGPVAFKGPLKNSENETSKDGYSRDLIIYFFLETEARRAELWNQEPGDINDTLADFLTSHGGDTTAMAALAPTVA